MDINRDKIETVFQTSAGGGKDHLREDCPHLRHGNIREIVSKPKATLPDAHLEWCEWCVEHHPPADATANQAEAQVSSQERQQTGLSLPEDLESFGDGFDRMHNPGTYALKLRRPPDVVTAWDREFDARPQWFSKFQTAVNVFYVGAAKDVLERLEQHASGDKQPTVLQVCNIAGIEDVTFYKSAEKAFDEEFNMAQHIREEYPHSYVHQR